MRSTVWKQQVGKQSTGGHHRGRVSEKMRKKRRKRMMAMRTAAVGGAEAMASDARWVTDGLNDPFMTGRESR